VSRKLKSVIALVLVLGLFSTLPLFGLVPAQTASNQAGASRIFIVVRNHSTQPLKTVRLLLNKANLQTEISLFGLELHDNVIVSPDLNLGEFSVQVIANGLTIDCIDYWEGWPNGFKLDIYDSVQGTRGECQSAQNLNRYSALDFALRRVPIVSADFTVRAVPRKSG